MEIFDNVNRIVKEDLAVTIENKKRFILELLDKNMLYVNLCDLDDEEYGISDADKAFTRSFYGLEGDPKHSGSRKRRWRSCSGAASASSPAISRISLRKVS